MSVGRREFLRGVLAASIAANVPVLEYVERRGIELLEGEAGALDRFERLVIEKLVRKMMERDMERLVSFAHSRAVVDVGERLRLK